MKQIILTCLVLAFALAGIASAQVMTQSVPAGFLAAPNNSGTSFPQNNTADHIWQWHYDSPQFNTQATITILEVYVRSTGSPVAPFNFPSWKVTMGTAITDYQVVNHDPTFALNWSGDEMIVRQGPWVGPGDPVGGTWMPMGITNPFVYNPTLGDFIVQIEKCGTIAVWGTSMDGASGTAGAGGGNRYGDTANCTATIHTFNNNEYVPLIKIDYILGGTPPPQEFQVNTDEAKLTLNGSSSNGFVATVLTQDIEVDPLGTLISPAAGTLAMSSTVAGSIYDILMNGSPTVPVSGAGLQIT